MKDHMCDFLPPKMSDRTTDLEASLTSMDWLPKLNVRDISEKAKNEKDEKSKKKTNGDADNDSHSKDGKPPYSYANLITLAINSSKSRKMTLSEIYSWICENFPYYQDIGTGWKNSIRHNLSLNKCFMKVARTKNDPGKGSYWAIDSSPQDEPIPFKRKRHTDEMTLKEKQQSGNMTSLRHDESSSCTSFNSSSGSPSFATSAQHYSAMTSPEHAGSPSHHSTPLNHFHSQPLPHNDHNNNQNVDVGINLANLPLTDLSASFKSFYRSVIEPTSQGFSRSNASIVSNDPAVNHSYNSSCSSQSFNNSNSHSHADHRRHHVNHISPLAQTHHHNMTPQQIHLNSSTESERMMRSPRTHYTRSRAHDMNNSVTLNQVNKSVNSASSSGFNFDLSNIESLKNSFMSVNWPDIDLNQFPDFLETMQRADSNDWELDQQTAIDLCSSLSRVFQQSGYGQQQYHQHHPSSSSISTSSSIGDTSCHMNRSYIAQPQISPQQQHLSRSIPISPPHAVSGDMRHMQTRSLSGSAPPPTSSPSMMQQNSMIPPPGYIQPPQQQSQQDDIPDTFDWDSIC